MPRPIIVTTQHTATVTSIKAAPAPPRRPRSPPLPPLVLPTPLPHDSCLVLTVRDLYNDRWTTIVAPKEWKVWRFKREALEKLEWADGDLVAPPRGTESQTRPRAGDLLAVAAQNGRCPETSAKGKENKGMDPRALERVMLELSDGGAAHLKAAARGQEQTGRSGLGQRKKSLGRMRKGLRLGFGGPTSKDRSLFPASPAVPNTPSLASTSSQLTPPRQRGISHATPFLSLASNFQTPPPKAMSHMLHESNSSSPFSFLPPSQMFDHLDPPTHASLVDRNSRRLSIQGLELINSSHSMIPGTTVRRSAESGRPLVGQEGVPTEMSVEAKRARRERDRKLDKLMRVTKLLNAVIGCYVDEAVVVGRKLVQFDVLVLMPSYSYFDRPLTTFHLPFFLAEVYVLKSSNSLSQEMRPKWKRGKSGKWLLHCLELDGVAGYLHVVKSLHDSTILRTFALPITDVAAVPILAATKAEFKENEFQPHYLASHSIVITFSSGRSCEMRPTSEKGFRDIMRVLRVPGRASGFAVKEDDEEWKVNAVRLAHASRHHHLTPLPPRPPHRPRRTAPLTTGYSNYGVEDPSLLPPPSDSSTSSTPPSLLHSSPHSSPPQASPSSKKQDRWSGSAISTSHRSRPSVVREEAEELHYESFAAPSDDGASYSEGFLVLPPRARRHSEAQEGDRTPRWFVTRFFPSPSPMGPSEFGLMPAATLEGEMAMMRKDGRETEYVFGAGERGRGMFA